VQLGLASAAPDVLTKGKATALPALLLFASGAAALVYQVLWVRQLSLVVGVDVYAVTVAVSAFFGGLALGGWLLGRLAERSGRPLRLYAGIEAGIAVLAAAVTYALGSAAAPFVFLEARVGALAWLLPMVLVALPAALMGGTLPVLMRVVAPSQDELGGSGGALYAANTAGAIAGALLGPFFLIPLLGVSGSAFAAAALNLGVALGALALDRRNAPLRKEKVKSKGQNLPSALAVYAIAGGIALGYEVVWSQAIVPFMSTRSFAFAVMLATYLAGLALGAALCARFADRVREPWVVFGLLIAAAGAVALLEMTLLGRWLVVAQTTAEAGVLALGGNALAGMSARFAVAAAWVVLVPTLLLGAAFPLAVRLGVDARRAGRDVGALVALNTLGGIVGTLLAGFVLLPMVGLVRTLAALALTAAALGAFAALQARGSRRLRTLVLAIGAVSVFAAAMTPADRLASLLPAARGGKLAFYDESAGGTVAVVQAARGGTEFRRLYIQGVSNSGDAMPSLRYMRLQALLPMVIHRAEPRSVLVIGFGTGITAGALLAYQGLERRVVAELLPAVVRAAPLFAGNFGAGSDPRIEIRLRDGRRELLRSAERYDLITLEPPPPSAAGVVNLYSTEFYRLAARSLEPDGLLAQWLPLPTQNHEDTRSLVRSFLDVFPYATLWSSELHEMLLIGSFEPIVLDWPRIALRASQPSVADALREVGIGSPAALLATWVTDRAGLERFAGTARAVTDDRPSIEYGAWVRPQEIVRVLPALREVATEPPIIGADDAVRANVRSERMSLWQFYHAGLRAYAGDRAGWERQMQAVAGKVGANPYYRWFGGR
jgi:predicted membrane-bound spermidine synthase